MSQPAPPILPLFRSENQLRLISYLVLQATGRMTVAELARATGVDDATASREVRRLLQAGLLRASGTTRQRRIEVDRDVPWFGELEGLLAKTVGAKQQLEHLFADHAGVDQAYIFGSWAARFLGSEGRWPQDVDVLIVGDELSPMQVRADLAGLERSIGVELNPTFAGAAEWDAAPDESFLGRLKRGPLVEITPAVTRTEPT
jgi:DNA-binding Lrp family transcriptional regulator